jgi:homoserine kinase
MEAGALGCSISGAGPTMFAWAQAEHAEQVLATMRHEFGRQSIALDEWIVDASSVGASLIHK